jgi:hypothetical protein
MTQPFPVPNEIRDVLEQVLAYAMPDEAEHFENTPPEERDGHIYQSLLTVRRWLDTGASGKAGPDTLAIQDLLEAHGYLATIWSVEDVQSVRPDLSDEQCREVLRQCGRDHDAEIGINWIVISTVADDLFPMTPPARRLCARQRGAG